LSPLDKVFAWELGTESLAVQENRWIFARSSCGLGGIGKYGVYLERPCPP
jgi:hypothetical protein